MPQDLLDCSREGLKTVATSIGAKPFAGAQLYQWLYQRGVADFAQMTNLSQAVRDALTKQYVVPALEPVDAQLATDGTRKFLFRLPDGSNVETVLIAMSPRKASDAFPGGDGTRRRTLCISTQVGCAMGCKFCRTATMGLIRHLRQSEILAQVLAVRRNFPEEVFTNIVLMGMGEPLHNYDAVVGALRILVDQEGLGFSRRHVTLSTVGLAPAIRKLGEEGIGIRLALSLHATTDELRQKLIPMARKYPLSEVLDACKAYCRALGPRHRVTFEYLLIKDVNDSAEDARRLVQIASNVPSKVNVIPLNPYPGCPWERPTDAGIDQFVEWLRDKNVQVNIRISRGQEILAACGQLATKDSGLGTRDSRPKA